LHFQNVAVNGERLNLTAGSQEPAGRQRMGLAEVVRKTLLPGVEKQSLKTANPKWA
jgi:hypothetical protein